MFRTWDKNGRLSLVNPVVRGDELAVFDDGRVGVPLCRNSVVPRDDVEDTPKGRRRHRGRCSGGRALSPPLASPRARRSSTVAVLGRHVLGWAMGVGAWSWSSQLAREVHGQRMRSKKSISGGHARHYMLYTASRQAGSSGTLVRVGSGVLCSPGQ